MPTRQAASFKIIYGKIFYHTVALFMLHACAVSQNSNNLPFGFTILC